MLKERLKKILLSTEDFVNWLLFPIALVLYLCRVRVLHTHYHAMGHLALDPYIWHLEQTVHKKRYRAILMPYITPLSKRRRFNKIGVSNTFLFECWKQHFTVISNYYLACFLAPLLYHPLLKATVKKYHLPNQPSLYSEFESLPKLIEDYKALTNEKPVLRLTTSNVLKGRAVLEKMGLGLQDKFICFSQRDDAFYPEENETVRFSSPSNLILALEEAVKRGYFCIRVSKLCHPLPKSLANSKYIIDYPYSPFTCDFMDIFLISQCTFFLCSNNGVCEITEPFATPKVTVNQVPFGNRPYNSRDLAIFKLQKECASGKMVPFKESMHSLLTASIQDKDYEALGIKLIENSPEEIQDLVVEMFERLESKDDIYSVEDAKLQQEFLALSSHLHRCHGYQSRIGRAFLVKYRTLLTSNKIVNDSSFESLTKMAYGNQSLSS